MIYETEVIANYFVKCGLVTGNYINLIKADKLVYFSHGWYLALENKPLVNEYVQARDWGVCFPNFVNDYRRTYFADPIKESLWNVDSDFNPYAVSVPTDTYIISLLDRIWEIYGAAEGTQLATLARESGSPWSRMDLSIKWPNIDNNDIREFFLYKMNKTNIENSIINDINDILND